MKKLLMIALLAAVVSTGYSQVHGRISGGYRPHTTVVVGGGFYSPYYSPFAYGFGYPYYGYQPSVAYRPSKLDQEIADINHDYSEKIESVRMDESIDGKERRHQIRELKESRDREIDLAKRNYYKQ